MRIQCKKLKYIYIVESKRSGTHRFKFFFSRIVTLVNKEYNQNCQNFAVNTDVEHLKFLYMIVFFGQLNILEK